MNNYHYIIAGLPVLTPDYRFTNETPDEILAGIVEQCSQRDREMIDFLQKGFRPEELSVDFYREALSSRNSFIREYFGFDLNLRNEKVSYLNRQLDRPTGKDIMDINPEDVDDMAPIEIPVFEEREEVKAVLEGDDLLSRERGIDELTWDKIDRITGLEVFSIGQILGFLAKLQIVSRWYRLDENTGREMFRKLVDEVRGTFKGVEYDAK